MVSPSGKDIHDHEDDGRTEDIKVRAFWSEGWARSYCDDGGHYGEELRKGLPGELSGMGDGHLDNLIGHMETPAAVTVMSEVDMAFKVKMVDKAPLMAILGAEANCLADHHEGSNLEKRSVNRLIGECSDKAHLVAILGADANYLADHHEDSNNYLADHHEDSSLVKSSVNRLIGDCSAYQIKADRTPRRADIMIGSRDARTSNTPTLEVVMNSEQNGGYVTEAH